MGHIINPHLYRLNYVISWSSALVAKKKFSAYFDTRNILINDFIDVFFKKYKNINKYLLYLLFFKIICINNTFILFLVFKQHKNYFKKKSKKILVKKIIKNSLFFYNKKFTVKYFFFKKKNFSLISNIRSINIFLNKIEKKIPLKIFNNLNIILLKTSKNKQKQANKITPKKVNKKIVFKRIKKIFPTLNFLTNKKIVLSKEILYKINKLNFLYLKESRNYKFKKYCSIKIPIKRIRSKYKKKSFLNKRDLFYKVFQNRFNIKLTKITKSKVDIANKGAISILKTKFFYKNYRYKNEEQELIKERKIRFFIKKKKFSALKNCFLNTHKKKFEKKFFTFTNLFKNKHSVKVYAFNVHNIKKLLFLKLNADKKNNVYKNKHMIPNFLDEYISSRQKYKLTNAFNSIKTKKKKIQFYKKFVKYSKLNFKKSQKKHSMHKTIKTIKNKINLIKKLAKKLLLYGKRKRNDSIKKKNIRIKKLSKVINSLKHSESHYALIMSKNIFKSVLKGIIQKKKFKSKNKFKFFSHRNKRQVDDDLKFVLNENYIKKLMELKLLKRRYKINDNSKNLFSNAFKKEKNITKKYKYSFLFKFLLSKIFLFEHYNKILNLKKKILNFFLVLYLKLDINIFIIIKSFWSSYVTSDMIAEYFILRLLQRKLVVEIMKPMIKFLNKSIRKKKIYGYAILLMGRFTRKDRATYKWYKKGPFTKSNRIVNIDYASRRVSLKFSTCSFKINLIKTIGYKNL